MKTKVSIQIINNAEKTGTNEHLYSKPLWPFLKGIKMKYGMKTRRVLIIKKANEMKTGRALIIKKRKQI